MGNWNLAIRLDNINIKDLHKKGSKQKCENYRTISLISHSSKIMLKMILNRLKHYTEEFISEEQAGFRAGKKKYKRIDI